MDEKVKVSSVPLGAKPVASMIIDAQSIGKIFNANWMYMNSLMLKEHQVSHVSQKSYEMTGYKKWLGWKGHKIEAFLIMFCSSTYVQSWNYIKMEILIKMI